MSDARDLSFVPVVNPAPRRLTSAQIEQYNTLGFVKPFDVFTEAEVTHQRAYFDRLLGEIQKAEDGRDQYAINCYHTACEGIYDIAINPTLLDFVEDIVGPNIICWATHYFCKLPYDERAVPWHQDASYWALTPARTVTVWLALDDADVENSAMKFIPCTHALGCLKWRPSTRPSVLNQEIEDIDALIARGGGVVYDCLKAGQMSLHADMLAHGSDPNRSARRRLGLTLRYCPPQVRATEPHWADQAIICRGRDPEGYWKHNPRPVGDDVRVQAAKKAKPIGGN